MVRIFNFSGGRSSAYCLLRCLDAGIVFDHIIFSNTGKELPQTIEFIANVESFVKQRVMCIEYTPSKPLFRVVDIGMLSMSGEPFQALINRRQYLPNVTMRFCTGDLKVKPVKRFLKSKGYKFWESYLGIRYDEPHRWAKILQNSHGEPWVNILPMVEWGTTQADVIAFWRSMPFDLKLQPHQGNCDLCFLKGKAKKIEILRQSPDVANWWLEIEAATGGQFNKYHSVKQLVELSRSKTLFDEEMDYPCFCNAD